MPASSKQKKSETSLPSIPSKISVLGFGYSDPLIIEAVMGQQYGTRLMPIIPGVQGDCIAVALSGAELIHNRQHLDGCKVFVFDRPDRLVRIKGVKPVDFDFEGPVSRFQKFTPAALNPEKMPKPTEVELESKPRDIIREMLDNSDGGILGGVLTFSYTIKNTKTRKDVTELVYPWFFGKTQPEHLFRKLGEQFKTTDFAELRKLFEEKAELIHKIKEAIRAYSFRRHPDLRAYCEERDVPFYDLHYLMKVVRSPKSKAKEAT